MGQGKTAETNSPRLTSLVSIARLVECIAVFVEDFNFNPFYYRSDLDYSPAGFQQINVFEAKCPAPRKLVQLEGDF
jgi:hypothetical protein